jgi:formiminoglutamase
MTPPDHPWLEVRDGDAPLIVAFPHTGTEIPGDIEQRLVSSWLSRRDADWWIDRLYNFAGGLGATTVRTGLSRTVIDVNRDPSGASLYPGQATTALCPETTFDGEPLWREGEAPDAAEIVERRARWFDPYHLALQAEISRLKALNSVVVLWDAHSIRSEIPRLFEGRLPDLNIGTNSGSSCSPKLTVAVEAACESERFTRITDGRFKGGWITRRYGRPEAGVHAIQMELSWRSYLDEPEDWAALPGPYDTTRAAEVRAVLERALRACLEFAAG